MSWGWKGLLRLNILEGVRKRYKLGCVVGVVDWMRLEMRFFGFGGKEGFRVDTGIKLGGEK